MTPALAGKEHHEISLAKTDLRNRTLNARDQLRRSYRDACSDRLVDFADLLEPVQGKIVSGFWPIRSELDPRPLMQSLKSNGARLALPVTLDRSTIEFRHYENDDDLIEAGFGTKGPSDKYAKVDPDIMLVPLSAFDYLGGRIGYGAGFYDRAIQKLILTGKRPQTYGIAFALQEVPRVPQDEHDITLDYVLTHEGLIHCNARN